jgi:hypothetical protein
MNIITLDVNQVLIGVFNFQGRKDASFQTLTHSCLLYPLFLVQVIVSKEKIEPF